ncbi:MAG: hypothetical protein LBB11_04385 [Puniceicoccales bacterium]|nr:hypothetical protein [Puniceicoccales bacterium]
MSIFTLTMGSAGFLMGTEFPTFFISNQEKGKENSQDYKPSSQDSYFQSCEESPLNPQELLQYPYPNEEIQLQQIQLQQTYASFQKMFQKQNQLIQKQIKEMQAQSSNSAILQNGLQTLQSDFSKLLCEQNQVINQLLSVQQSLTSGFWNIQQSTLQQLSLIQQAVPNFSAESSVKQWLTELKAILQKLKNIEQQLNDSNSLINVHISITSNDIMAAMTTSRNDMLNKLDDMSQRLQELKQQLSNSEELKQQLSNSGASIDAHISTTSSGITTTVITNRDDNILHELNVLKQRLPSPREENWLQQLASLIRIAVELGLWIIITDKIYAMLPQPYQDLIDELVNRGQVILSSCGSVIGDYFSVICDTLAAWFKIGHRNAVILIDRVFR